MSDTSKKTATADTAATKAPAVKPEAKPEPVMYVGPTIKGVATYGTVYTTVPTQAKEIRANAPQFLNLFVPVREYGAADEMVRSQKGYVYEAYKEAWKLREKKEA